MITEKALEVIACPTCKNTLVLDSESVICKKCNKAYSIKDGIIDFLAKETLDERKSLNSEYHDKEVEFYDDMHLHMSKEKRLFRRITRNLEGSSVLDIGTGTGFVLDNFQRNVEFVCLDISSRMLRRASAKHPGRIFLALRADAESLPINDRMMDIVVISSTLHHLPHWERCMTEVNRVLRKHGRLIIFHEPCLTRHHGFFYRISRRIYRKLYGPKMRQLEKNRLEKAEDIAQRIFGFNREESWQRIQEVNRIVNVHGGFDPFTLLNSADYRNIAVKTYYAEQTAYHGLMGTFFPKNGELFYITATRR